MTVILLPNMGLHVWLMTSRQTDPDLKISYPREIIIINKMNLLGEACRELLSSRKIYKTINNFYSLLILNTANNFFLTFHPHLGDKSYL